MGDFFRWIGGFRVDNLAENFGVLSDTIEVILTFAMMLGGIILTYMVQKWADKSGEVASAANVGRGGGEQQYEDPGLRA